MANKRFIDFPIATTVGDNDIILIWQSGANKQTTKATILSGVPDSLNDLTDVTISGLTNGQILRYDSVSGQWENTDQGNLDLNDLNDVTIVSPTNGQVLVYNSTTSKWENSSAGFVPYVGAVTTVDLGLQGLEAGYVRFDTSVVSVPNNQGTMYWDASKSTVALIMNGTLQHIGQDTFFYCKNSTGSPIPKGTSVRFAGTDGASGHILITPFLANGSVPSNYFIGVTAEAISNGSFGQVMHFGELDGINTSSYTSGALLYASTTVAGGFQTTAPVAPNNIVLVAAAVNSKNNGSIVVRPTYGSNINTDEGVKITSPTTGDLLQLQAGGLWENKTKAQVLGGTLAQFVKGDGSLDSTLYVPTTRTITINGTSQDLSANRTFNVGTVTSVAALTLGTTGTDLSSTVANGTTTPVITLNVPTASATNRGALSAADWSMFNAKQNALTLTTTGTSGAATLVGATLNIPNYGSALSGYLPLTGGTLTGPLGGTSISLSGDITANRYRGVNSLVLNSYTTVNPSSNVYLYSPPNDRDAWIYLDSADTGSNWGIYHRQIDSAVSGLPDNSIGFVGGGTNTLQAWISLANGNGFFAGSLTAANLSGTNTGNVTIGTANGLSLSGQSLSLGLASGSTNGALSSSDWTTFNNKQNALTNPVTGTGTTNYLPKFTGSTTIGNSQIFDNGTNVGIGSNTGLNNLVTFTQTIGGSPANLSELEPFATVKIKGRPDRNNIVYIGALDALTGMIIQSGTTSSAAPLTIQPFGGNLLVGTTSDNGARLQVTGTGTFSGAYGTANAVIVSGTTYATINTNRGATNSSAGINYSSLNVQKWFNGIYENSDNFGFYSVGTSGFPLILNYFTGAATFSSSLTANGTATFLAQFGNGNNVNEKIIQFLRASASTDIVNIQGINAGVGASAIALQALGGNVLIGTTTDNGNRLRVNGNAWFDGGINPTKTAKNTYGIQIRGSLYGAPRLQVYDLNADPNGYMGLGTDMSGAPYEFSNYFSRTAGLGRWSVGSWAGDFGTGQYVSGYNEKLFINENAAQFNVPLTIKSNNSGNSISLIGRSVDNASSIDFFNSSSTTALMEILVDSVSADINYLVDNAPMKFFTYSVPRMTISGSGLVGINTETPATNLHVQGASVSYGQIRFLNSSSSGEASMHIGRTNQTLEQRWTIGQGVAGIGDSFGFYTGGSSRVNLQTNGNVLIGTTSDVGAKLYVNGDIRTGALGGGYVSGYWKMGRAILGTQPTETYQIIVEINGALYAIGAANL